MAPTLAKRFAAKEACSKALGTGFSRGVFLRDIGVVNLRSGQPTLSLTGGALEFTINVAADGSTEASKCVPPTGLLQSVECSVTVIGIADGTLQALVAVGV